MNTDTENRWITSGVTTEVSSSALGHVQLEIKTEGVTVVTVEMPWADAKKLFHDLSHVLGHHSSPV